jgi:hypothetical protein
MKFQIMKWASNKKKSNVGQSDQERTSGTETNRQIQLVEPGHMNL